MQTIEQPTAPAADAGIDQATLDDIRQAGGMFQPADMPAGQAVTSTAASAGDPALAGMIGGGLVVTFNLLAKMRGDHWALDADSANEAGEAYAAVILKYFPNIQSGPEITALLITAALIAPRIMVDKAISAQREAEKIAKRQREAGADGTQSEQ
jgi:hypothetical protein